MSFSDSSSPSFTLSSPTSSSSTGSSSPTTSELSSNNYSSVSLSSISTISLEDEDSLIEILKESLKLTIDNEFLEAEIEDLKEFFTVKLIETAGAESLDSQSPKSCSNTFWLQVYLPITVRMEKELFKSEKPLISFKIFNKKVEEHEEGEQKIVYSDKIELESRPIEAPSKESESMTTSKLVPYKILDCKVSELSTSESEIDSEGERVEVILLEILKNLIRIEDTSILNVIEDFYIKLEEVNYPAKEVICRDYYYPVFDCRHWGRFKDFSSRKTIANSGASGTTALLSIGQINESSSSSSSSSSTGVSYRARALYDFQALMQGELSFKENEILLVLANLGNGWLTARRISETPTTSENMDNNDNTGLVPENYIERI